MKTDEAWMEVSTQLFFRWILKKLTTFNGYGEVKKIRINSVRQSTVHVIVKWISIIPAASSEACTIMFNVCTYSSVEV